MDIQQSAEEKMTEVKTAMLLHVPFFASLMLDMMVIKIGKFPDVFPPGNETFATNGKTIWCDEDFLASLKLPEAVFTFCHEIGHAMWSHMSRAERYRTTGIDGKPFNAKKWNYAGDYIINDMLTKSKIGIMPQCGLLDSKYTHEEMTADEVYRDLPEDPDDNSNGQGQIDHHIPADDNTTEAEWNRAVAQAADGAKAQGKLPASLERMVEKLLNPKVPWQELLRTILMRAASRDAYTWARPNRRRLITQGVVMPSYTGFGAGEIVIGVDTSGSIGEKELTVFLTEIQNILDVAKPEKIYVVPCDTCVHEVSVLEANDDLLSHKPPLGGGGGTRFSPVFDWVEEQGIDPAALVYLTDMYGDFPDEPPYKTIWASTSKGMDAPWGSLVEIDLEEYGHE